MNPIKQHPVLGLALTAEDVHSTYKGSEAATLVSNLVEHAASVIEPLLAEIAVHAVHVVHGAGNLSLRRQLDVALAR